MTVPLRVERVTKHFGQSPVVDDVSFELKRGELLALLGPSGSGKTTLLRIIAGLDVPDRGDVYFGDTNSRDISLADRRIGFVFQHYALFKHMTVFENIAFGLRARKRSSRITSREIESKVSDLISLMQIDGLDARYPSQLSGGQRQRVALARALAIDPRMLLLDEPFGALDAMVRRDLRKWFRSMHETTGNTTMFVTHDQDEAFAIADRIAVLNCGRIEHIGTPSQLADAPKTPFVAHFLDGIRGLKTPSQAHENIYVLPRQTVSRS